MKRRNFLKTSSLAGLAAAVPASLSATIRTTSGQEIQPSICLNAYSFNRQLRSGEINLDEMFRFASETGFEAVDLTAYYITGYPEVPADEVLFGIKKMAFRYGINIAGTGVKNDFALVDAQSRAGEVQLVKNWVVAAAKLGATSLRVFSGRTAAEGYPREEVKTWIKESLQQCADFASEHGVMIAYQNHDD